MSLALLGGYGFSPGSTADANYLGGGIGARAGYTFAAPAGFAVAVEALYHFGYERSDYSPGFGSSTRSKNALYLGAVVGLDGALGPVVVRPYGIVGLAVTSYECMGCTFVFGAPPSSETLPLFGAGLELRFLTSVVFAGVDARVLGQIVRDSVEPAAAVYGLVGARFR